MNRSIFVVWILFAAVAQFDWSILSGGTIYVLIELAGEKNWSFCITSSMTSMRKNTYFQLIIMCSITMASKIITTLLEYPVVAIHECCDARSSYDNLYYPIHFPVGHCQGWHPGEYVLTMYISATPMDLCRNLGQWLAVTMSLNVSCHSNKAL